MINECGLSLSKVQGRDASVRGAYKCSGIVRLIWSALSYIQAALSIHGMCGGPMLGLFTLGLVFPFVNWKVSPVLLGCFHFLSPLSLT